MIVLRTKITIIMVSNVECIFQVFSLLQLTKLEGATTNFRDTCEAQRLSAFQGYANLVTPNIQRVVEFAKRVPGNMTCSLKRLLFARM